MADMPADQQARYDVLLRENQRLQGVTSSLRMRAIAAEAEVDQLRRALGLHAATSAPKPSTTA